MDPRRILVFGTHNRKKALELSALLSPHGFELQTLCDWPGALRVEETGGSFAENARLKAIVQARHLGQWVLGEDSGLSVDALDGAPGIYSSRFAGPDATDQRNNAHLLAQLGDTPLEQRMAHYVCHMTVADPEGQAQADSEAVCHGRIRFYESPARWGFGYDPLFEIVEYHRTFSELGNSVKSVLSHRARAFRRLLPQLEQLVHQGVWQPLA